jgi:hypothetical protein
MQKSESSAQHSEQPKSWQLYGNGYNQLYRQFAYHFNVQRGNINQLTANLAGVRLAKNLIFGTDGELQELFDGLNKLLENPSLENLVEVADGAADSIYVILQLCHALDIPIDQVFQAVHDNNMTKIAEDGTVKRRADGKVLKPDGYKPVDIWSVLHEHSNLRAREAKALGAENWKIE